MSDCEAGGLFIIRKSDREECETPGRPILRGVNHDQKRAVFFRPACGLWSCPACAKTNRWKLRQRAMMGVEKLALASVEAGEYSVPNFLTLTPHEALSASQSISVWPSAWSMLRKRARRAAPGLEYLIVYEVHQSGKLHAHALETAGLGERWWKDNGRECGLGYMAEEVPIKNAAGAGWYVTKYLTKNSECQGWPKSFHRYSASHGWPKLAELEKPPGWAFTALKPDEQLDLCVHRLEQQGYEVAFRGNKSAWLYVQTQADQ